MRDIRVVTQVIVARAKTTVEVFRRACPPRATRPKRLAVPFGGHNIVLVFISIFVHYAPRVSRKAERLSHHAMRADPESMSRCDHGMSGPARVHGHWQVRTVFDVGIVATAFAPS
jgi:hypothetical protein